MQGTTTTNCAGRRRDNSGNVINVLLTAAKGLLQKLAAETSFTAEFDDRRNAAAVLFRDAK
jgi:hypothetical protein